eukprot:scaffold48155_cov67-Phaeocystis_antarctica.AAC.1
MKGSLVIAEAYTLFSVLNSELHIRANTTVLARTSLTRQGGPARAMPAGRPTYSSSSDAGSSCLWPLPRNLLKYSALMASIGGE